MNEQLVVLVSAFVVESTLWPDIWLSHGAPPHDQLFVKVGVLTVNCADTKVDKNIGIFAAQFMRPTRDRHLDAVSNEHRP